VKRVTVDSNIYLSALVFGGKPKRILEMAIEGEIEVAVSDPIIEEVQRHLLGKFGWSEARAAETIESIWEFATHVPRPRSSTRFRPTRMTTMCSHARSPPVRM
jgi:uncharacterized protein